jgi:uncharacterized protein (DUF427 family)
MSSRPVLEPSTEHPITIEPTPGHVTVEINGQRVADTTSALTLQEASYPPVQYIPLSDVDRSLLQSSDTHTYCPFKGEASYYSVTIEGQEPLTDVIWTYEQPHAAVAEIADHVAFYPDRAQVAVSD